VLIKYWDGEIEYTEDAIAALKPIAWSPRRGGVGRKAIVIDELFPVYYWFEMAGPPAKDPWRASGSIRCAVPGAGLKCF
jgi:hypothetical protein